MSLHRFYRQPLDFANNTLGSTIDLRLQKNIDRLTQQISLSIKATAEDTEAHIAKILWQQLSITRTTTPTNLRQDCAIAHWYVFLLNIVYEEVCRIDRLLPTARRVELTRGNLFESGRNIADRPEQFFAPGSNPQMLDSTISYRQFVRNIRLKVASKMRDIINQLEGSKTYGHTNIGLVSGATSTRVEKALIYGGFNPGNTDFCRLKLLHQVVIEVRMAIPERIDRWESEQFQLVTARFNHLATSAQLPTYPNATTTKEQLEKLGQWIRNYLDPPSISLDAPISRLNNDDDREIDDSISTPPQPDSAERWSAAIVIKEYLNRASNTHTHLLCIKYGLAIDKITLTDLSVELQIGYTSVRYHLTQIFQQLRDLLAEQLNEPKNLETLRLIEQEIEIYYSELLERNLTAAVQKLAQTDRQYLWQIYLNDRHSQENIDRANQERIYNILIANVGDDLLRLFNIARFVPNGQARQLIATWIATQLQQRPQQYL
jgi:hypothetical protein